MSIDLSVETILIVDDEPDNLEVAQQTLELLYDARVVACTSGQAALDRLTNEVTIILCDLMMPGMNGYELLPRLRAQTHCPIIALTAAAMQHDRDNAVAAGFDGYITKPFEADRLADDIASIVKPIRAARQSQNEAPQAFPPRTVEAPGAITSVSGLVGPLSAASLEDRYPEIGKENGAERRTS